MAFVVMVANVVGCSCDGGWGWRWLLSWEFGCRVVVACRRERERE